MAEGDGSSKGELKPPLCFKIRWAGACGAEHLPVLPGTIQDPRWGQIKG